MSFFFENIFLITPLPMPAAFISQLGAPHFFISHIEISLSLFSPSDLFLFY